MYRLYAPVVAKFAFRLGSPSSDVEDIVHDVFLVVERRLPAFREREGTLSTWLFRITQNVVRERRRSQRWRKWLLGLGAPAARRVVAAPAGNSRNEAADAVYSVLEGVPEKYRTTLILFEIEGMTGEEIASLTGEPVATVWVRLHRGRALMLKRARQLGLGASE